MARRLVAKFCCDSVAENGDVRLSAVYSDDPNDPNHRWSEATPWGDLQMGISNPAAQGFFEEGEEYLLEIRPAEGTYEHP